MMASLVASWRKRMEDMAKKREDQEMREFKKKLKVKARLQIARRGELEGRVRLELARMEV